MKKREYDESDVRSRPKPRTRPRTKDRPNYSQAELGYVTQTDRGRCQVLLPNQITVNAMKARELGKGSVVVGDYVAVVGDLSGTAGTLARIVEVKTRKNSLSRTVDDIWANEKVIVSNIDQLGIVIAAADPEPRIGLVDRALVIAYDQGIKPLIIVTKCDLADPNEFLANYAELDIDYLTISRESELTPLFEKLIDRRTVFFGHSGVGKSTLVNRLAGFTARSTGGVNEVTGRGRHTSSNALALPLDLAGENFHTWIIDTPGVRSFGLSHINPDRVYRAFPELASYLATCPKNCSHNEIDCALNEINSGPNEQLKRRLASLQRILAS
jgi:ribosome biogenesis GTPase / thiamine phosphate phosphatase